MAHEQIITHAPKEAWRYQPATAPTPPARKGAPAPTNPARVLTARAQRAASRALERQGATRTAAAFEHHPGTPLPTIHGWFNRLTLSLKTLTLLGKLTGMSPAALLLSEEEREGLEDVARALSLTGATATAECLIKFLNGSRG